MGGWLLRWRQLMNIRTSTPARTTPSGEPPRRPGSRAIVILVAVLILAAGAVGAVLILSDDESDVGTTTQPTAAQVTTPTTVDAQAQARAAVIDAYKKSYAEFVAAAKEASPNPDDPRLARYSSGAALIAKQRSLADLRSKGQVLTGDIELHPSVVALTSDTATVVDCNIDRTARIDGRTGSTVVGAGTGAFGASSAKLRLEGGVWKVTDFTDEKRSCVPPAA
jgi:hypothetical protein